MIDHVLAAEAARLIERLADGGRDDAARDALLGRLEQAQAAAVAPYRRFLAAAPAHRGRAPALPAEVFRFARVAGHDPSADARVFRTSGTTAPPRGEHALCDLSLYDRAARAAARHMLFPDVARMRLVVLSPAEREAPDSSLSYMLARFVEWFGAQGSGYVWRDGSLDLPALRRALRACERDGTKVALLGTSFAFVHAEDAFSGERFALPAGSRIMQTGGFKGRSRSVEPAELLAALALRYGIAPEWIVQEYGMTELCSQLYETTLRDAALGRAVGPRRLWAPGWVRAEPVDPETLLPVSGDAVGLLRIDDLANAYSVCALQTADLARRAGDGLVLLGRARSATPRGCSLAVDELRTSA